MVPLQLHISNHIKTITFFVTTIPQDIILIPGNGLAKTAQPIHQLVYAVRPFQLKTLYSGMLQ
jgi:hypothetical protein